MAHLVNNLPAMWETWVRSLGWEDPLEEGMPIHSSILAWSHQGSPFQFTNDNLIQNTNISLFEV